MNDTRPHKGTNSNAEKNLLLLKVLGFFIFALCAVIQFAFVFCDMRGEWATQVTDACSIYARTIFPWIFLLDAFFLYHMICARHLRTLSLAILAPAVLSISIAIALQRWTTAVPALPYLFAK